MSTASPGSGDSLDFLENSRSYTSHFFIASEREAIGRRRCAKPNHQNRCCARPRLVFISQGDFKVARTIYRTSRRHPLFRPTTLPTFMYLIPTGPVIKFKWPDTLNIPILTSLSFSVVLRLRRFLDCEQLLVHHASSNQAQHSYCDAKVQETTDIRWRFRALPLPSSSG